MGMLEGRLPQDCLTPGCLRLPGRRGQPIFWLCGTLLRESYQHFETSWNSAMDQKTAPLTKIGTTRPTASGWCHTTVPKPLKSWAEIISHPRTTLVPRTQSLA